MNVMEQDSFSGLGEAELELRARAGEPRAAGRLLEMVREDLVRFCYRYLANVDEAEDAAQDVLATMMDRPWPQQHYRPYMLRAARNRCLDICRKREGGGFGFKSSLGASRLPSPRTGPKTAAARKEEQESLQRHLAALSRAQAEVLTLRYFEGLRGKEIAEVLDLPESVVKSRLYEALKALDKLVKRAGH